jgi:fructosamine-3-kinase
VVDGVALDAVTELTGVPATSAHRLSGSVYEVELADGDLVVAKHHDHPSAVLAEAKSLDWIAEPGVLPVPAVRGHNDQWLVIEQIEPGQPADAEALGRGLAELHLAGAPAFGSPPPDGPADAWIGLAPMTNVPVATWPEFYASQRILPYVRQAGLDAKLFDAVCVRLSDLVPEEPPARLHGDLWSGNVHWATDGRAWLIDPAAHGGHRETDLAMLQLFGCPLLARVLGAYHERYPLADGWQARVPLHQLFPLLVHAVLFGGGYASQAMSAARAALRA